MLLDGNLILQIPLLEDPETRSKSRDISSSSYSENDSLIFISKLQIFFIFVVVAVALFVVGLIANVKRPSQNLTPDHDNPALQHWTNNAIIGS